MGARTGNPAWKDHPDLSTPITAAALNAVESALDGTATSGHTHDARYVRTVNGTGPDGNGNVVVSGGGSVTDHDNGYLTLE